MCRVEGCKDYDQETFEIYFGTEDDPEAKFILLEDCGHSIEEKALF